MVIADVPPFIIKQLAEAYEAVRHQHDKRYTDTQIARTRGVHRNTVAKQRATNVLPMRDAGTRTTGRALALAGVIVE